MALKVSELNTGNIRGYKKRRRVGPVSLTLKAGLINAWPGRFIAETENLKSLF